MTLLCIAARPTPGLAGYQGTRESVEAGLRWAPGSGAKNTFGVQVYGAVGLMVGTVGCGAWSSGSARGVQRTCMAGPHLELAWHPMSHVSLGVVGRTSVGSARLVAGFAIYPLWSAGLAFGYHWNLMARGQAAVAVGTFGSLASAAPPTYDGAPYPLEPKFRLEAGLLLDRGQERRLRPLLGLGVQTDPLSPQGPDT